MNRPIHVGCFLVRPEDGARVMAHDYHVLAAKDLRKDGWVHEDGTGILVYRGPRMATKKKKASGVNIPNRQRHTVQLLLRLPPDIAEDLDDLAERWGLTRSGAVGRLVEEATDVESVGE